MSWIQWMMVQSKALWKADPVTYPTQYSYYDQQINFESRFGYVTQSGGIATYAGFMAATVNTLLTGAIGGGSLVPSVGFAPYEGGPGNNPGQPGAILQNGQFPTSIGIFQEYVPQACSTANEGLGWTALVANMMAVTWSNMGIDYDSSKFQGYLSLHIHRCSAAKY